MTIRNTVPVPYSNINTSYIESEATYSGFYGATLPSYSPLEIASWLIVAIAARGLLPWLDVVVSQFLAHLFDM